MLGLVDSFKTELIADRVWRTHSQLELAVVACVCASSSALRWGDRTVALLFLGIAVKLVAALDGLTLLSGLLADPIGLEVVWLLRAGSDLFLPYRVRDNAL